MRALTLTQPWAGLVAAGIKRVENRPRHMIKREDFGQRFAIHASREIRTGVYERIYEAAPELMPVTPAQKASPPPWFTLSTVTSAVIAVATIDRVFEWTTDEGFPTVDESPLPADLRGQERFMFGPVIYVLRDIVALETAIPCRGMLGFWTLPVEVELAIPINLRAAPPQTQIPWSHA